MAGIRQTMPLSALAERFPAIHAELLEIFDRLERHYRDMLDTEFTIEQGKLWMLQTRVGKRTGRAALRMAVEMTTEAEISLTHAEAVAASRPSTWSSCCIPSSKGEHRGLMARGLAASPGPESARRTSTRRTWWTPWREARRSCWCAPRPHPTTCTACRPPRRVLTSRGGLVSHAAVVARGWGIPAVVGAEPSTVDRHHFIADGITVREGEWHLGRRHYR